MKNQNEFATREEMIQEACTRLEMLNLHPDVLSSFKKNQTLFYSERQSLKFNELFADNMFDYIGTLYHIKNNDEFVYTIKNFEEKSCGLVYHATYEKLDFGRCLDLFYVTKYKDEWSYNRKELKDGYSFVYTVNLTNKLFSECGLICFKKIDGGLIRTA